MTEQTIDTRLTPDAARILTDEVKVDLAKLWAKLLRLYEEGAHAALGYGSWGDYYEAEFGKSGQYGYRLLDAARVLEVLEPTTSSDISSSSQLATESKEEIKPVAPPQKESVARELVPVLKTNPDQVEEVWAEVVDEHGPEPTAEQTRKTVQRKQPTKAKSEPMQTFRTELRFQHEAPDEQTANEWAKKVAGRLVDQGAVKMYRNTRAG